MTDDRDHFVLTGKFINAFFHPVFLLIVLGNGVILDPQGIGHNTQEHPDSPQQHFRQFRIGLMTVKNKNMIIFVG